jgi:hypothetical protein
MSIAVEARDVARGAEPYNLLELSGLSSPPTPDEIFSTSFLPEPLVPVGGNPTQGENNSLAAALRCYSSRSNRNDFSSLTDFVEAQPNSPWNPALLTNLGLEYYRSGYYSRTMPAWAEAWRLAKDATDSKGKGIADRAVGELAYMYGRLGRMTELDALLKSLGNRKFSGPATERIAGAREGLISMKTRPEISFRCSTQPQQR